MCEPASMAAYAMMAGAAATVYTAATTKALKVPDPAQPERPPQEAKRPEEALRRKGTALSGVLPGGSATSTLLTGPDGIAPGMLNLGKSKLLGE